MIRKSWQLGVEIGLEKEQKLQVSNQKKTKFRKIIYQSEEQSKARQMEAAHDAYQMEEHFKVALRT